MNQREIIQYKGKIGDNLTITGSFIHIGIEANKGFMFKLNEKNFEVGKTGFYEISNCKDITTLTIENSNSIFFIDIIKEKED